jgi:hypothetical protein
MAQHTLHVSMITEQTEATQSSELSACVYPGSTTTKHLL